MTCERKDACPRPRARRKWRNRLWVCPGCGQGWVCYDIGSWGGIAWVWGKWPREKEEGPLAERAEWEDMS